MKSFLAETQNISSSELNKMFEYKESFSEQTTKKLNKQAFLNLEKYSWHGIESLSLDETPKIGVKWPLKSEFSLIGEGADYREDR